MYSNFVITIVEQHLLTAFLILFIMFNNQQTISTTGKNSNGVQRNHRGKLHRVTQMTDQDYKALGYKPQPISKKHLRERIRTAFYFITDKGLLHEFIDFVNAKTA